MSNSLKYATLSAKYVFANNLTASASVGSINLTTTSSFKQLSFNNLANFSALSDFSPTIILDGYKLSYNAFPSLKNSGLNIIFSISYFSFIACIKPTGTVDLTTIVVFIFISFTFFIISSTVDVSK